MRRQDRARPVRGPRLHENRERSRVDHDGALPRGLETGAQQIGGGVRGHHAGADEQRITGLHFTTDGATARGRQLTVSALA
jgi:hypothetical protein